MRARRARAGASGRDGPSEQCGCLAAENATHSTVAVRPARSGIDRATSRAWQTSAARSRFASSALAGASSTRAAAHARVLISRGRCARDTQTDNLCAEQRCDAARRRRDDAPPDCVVSLDHGSDQLEGKPRLKWNGICSDDVMPTKAGTPTNCTERSTAAATGSPACVCGRG